MLIFFQLPTMYLLLQKTFRKTLILHRLQKPVYLTLFYYTYICKSYKIPYHTNIICTARYLRVKREKPTRCN